MTNKEKFLELVDRHDPSTMEAVKFRIENREMLRESFSIALKMIDRLDELNWTQVQLAKKMNVSPQQVNKILRGKENLTLETLLKIQEVLEIPLLASHSEKKQAEKPKVFIAYSKNMRYSLIERMANSGHIDKRTQAIVQKVSERF